jgi:heat-inducible transcriptional repressor
VDTILQLRPLKAEERERIERQYASSDRRIDEVLREAVKSLSRLSRYAGVVMAPRVEATVFRHIDFVPLAPGRVLVIFVSRSGEVHNKIIETGVNLPATTLEQMTNYLNRVMNGLPLDTVREKIAAEMAQAKVEHDDLQRRALALSGQALAGEEGDARVYIEGTSNILDQPEFADVARMRQLYRVFEQKSQLVDLLDRSRRAHGIQIFIGNETSHSAIAGCSLVTATYETREGTIGSLGVIGPSRMPYAQVIPIVDYTARIVSQLLEEEYQ